MSEDQTRPERVVKSMPVETRIEADTPLGEFDAVVSVFNTVDSVGDVVMPGAFAESLADYAAKGRGVPVVWNHDWDDIWSHIGVADAEETSEGLLIHARLDMENPTAQQAYKLLKDGRVAEFSFAARVMDDGWELDEAPDGTIVSRLTRLDLIEAGPTLKGAHPDTRLVSVKHDSSGSGVARSETPGKVSPRKRARAILQTISMGKETQK